MKRDSSLYTHTLAIASSAFISSIDLSTFLKNIINNKLLSNFFLNGLVSCSYLSLKKHECTSCECTHTHTHTPHTYTHTTYFSNVSTSSLVSGLAGVCASWSVSACRALFTSSKLLTKMAISIAFFKFLNVSGSMYLLLLLLPKESWLLLSLTLLLLLLIALAVQNKKTR